MLATIFGAILCGCQGRTDAGTATSLARQREERFRQINASLVGRAPEVVFVGDSITQCWEREGEAVWRESYAPRGVANLGSSGDRTGDCLWRLRNGNLDGICPRVAVVLIGTNDLAALAQEPSAVVAGVGQIVRELRSRFPALRILVLGLFPRDDLPRAEAAVPDVNRLLAAQVGGWGVSFDDLGARLFRGPSGVRRELMPDGLHLNPAGYRAWAQALEPWLAEALATAPPCTRAASPAPSGPSDEALP